MAMPVSGTQGKDFSPAPEGLHNAVLVDIVDLGIQPGFEGKQQHKVRFVWEIDAPRPAEEGGGRFLVFQTYGVSLADRANLRKDLKNWRGVDFTPEELKSFDIETLIGKPCRLLISHNASGNGKTYANIQSVLKPDATKLKPSGDYKRKKDRDDWATPKSSPWHPDNLKKAQSPEAAAEDEGPSF